MQGAVYDIKNSKSMQEDVAHNKRTSALSTFPIL